MLRSNSLNTDMSNFILKYDVLLTHDGVLAKEDVDKSDILLPGVVELTHLRAKPNSFLASSDMALAAFQASPVTLRRGGCPCVSFLLGLARWRCRRGSGGLPFHMFGSPK